MAVFQAGTAQGQHPLILAVSAVPKVSKLFSGSHLFSVVTTQ